jgi:hypothetical protein
MNKELQRIAIAEACGYKDVTTRITEGTFKVITGFKNHNFDEEIPDYLNDLNAMHEAEKTLDDDLDLDYSENLEIVAGARWGANNYRSATAAQRAEAFLRTLNLWEL